MLLEYLFLLVFVPLLYKNSLEKLSKHMCDCNYSCVFVWLCVFVYVCVLINKYNFKKLVVCSCSNIWHQAKINLFSSIDDILRILLSYDRNYFVEINSLCNIWNVLKSWKCLNYFLTIEFIALVFYEFEEKIAIGHALPWSITLMILLFGQYIIFSDLRSLWTNLD
mgnify:CR=1 FL=1